MLRLRLSLLAVLAILLAGTVVWTQEKREDPKEPVVIPRGRLPANWKKVGLTDKQANEIRKIRGLNRYRIQQLEKQIQQIRKEELVQMLKVLTDAQKVRLKEVVPGIKIPEEKPATAPKKPATDKGT